MPEKQMCVIADVTDQSNVKGKLYRFCESVTIKRRKLAVILQAG